MCEIVKALLKVINIETTTNISALASLLNSKKQINFFKKKIVILVVRKTACDLLLENNGFNHLNHLCPMERGVVSKELKNSGLQNVFYHSISKKPGDELE